jgi:predicted ribosome quality control (RQC) complex YloA/Tae2 family protein
MFKNYFYLNRFIVEANRSILGSRLSSAFSQDKDKLILALKKESADYFLEISVNPGSPYILMRNNFRRAKKNSIDLFEEFTPSIINHFSIASADRIVKISLKSFDIFFPIRGKFTNIILTDKTGSFKTFKKDIDKNTEDFLSEIKTIGFISDFNIPELKIEQANEIKENIKKKYPFIGREILTEADFRSEHTVTPEKYLQIISRLLMEIRNENPTVFYDESEINLAPKTFNIFQRIKRREFKTFSDALGFYLSKKYYLNKSVSLKGKIEKHISRELGKVSSKLNNLKGRIEKGNRSEEYEKIGNILLINLYSLKSGMNEIELPDIYNNDISIKIKLKPEFSPKQNAEAYFDKAKNERISFEKSKELFASSKEQYNKLKNIEQRLSDIEDTEELKKIMRELKMKENTPLDDKKDELKNKFKQYLIEGNYYLYVGRDSKNNDLLTTKFAKQNDYWFHARSVPGSHVVLRIENTKDPVPKNILKKAASLAAYHSKAKTSGLAPVSYTQKKYVVKKKGMDIGKVALLKEEVLLVKPEIPSGVEFLSE